MNIFRSLLCKYHFPLSFNKLIENSGTGNHTVKTFNFDGRELSRVEPYSSFLHQARQGQAPIAATAFHPHRMMLACAARGDNHINLFTCANPAAEKKSTGGFSLDI
jgi:regulator-associated protein of mTOR